MSVFLPIKKEDYKNLVYYTQKNDNLQLKKY